ncbi:MAG: M20/M25/M40 family metallo-hydrolase [Gammaproteobacteria bacterium]|nr:M20/M25/M40 family metallo-hydrolase [Gammaproteobacteria bacterium]
MDTQHLSQFVTHAWEADILPSLREYIRIPNKSPAFEPDWESLPHMRDAAELLARWVGQYPVRGLTYRIVTLPGRTPLLYAEVAPSGASARTVLMYGHYDKQPEFDGWNDGLGPWQPVMRDGKLYGRGGADDGYALFASLTAIAALQAQGAPHPRCVLLIEGCEESGSYDLPDYMDALASDIGQPDLVVCLDAECGNYDQLWLTTSLRGAVGGLLTVQVLTEGVHSGAAGGIVPSSFRILRALLERLENAETGTLAAPLNVNIPAGVRREAAAVAEALGDLSTTRFPWAGRTHAGEASPAELVLANTWQPSLAVVGLGGAPPVAEAGNTLRPATMAKLVFRLPPTLDADTAANTIKDILEDSPPHGAEVSFEIDHPMGGWHSPPRAPWLEAALDEASQAYFGRPLMTMGTGGTIPFMKMLGERYRNVQFAVTGVLGPKSNAHGPNEFLHIDCAKRVTACIAHLLGACANV